jgi:hypothetical protein
LLTALPPAGSQGEVIANDEVLRIRCRQGPVSDSVEGRHPVAITCERVTVDDARLGSKPRQRFDNQRETICRSLPGRLCSGLRPGSVHQMGWPCTSGKGMMSLFRGSAAPVAASSSLGIAPSQN